MSSCHISASAVPHSAYVKCCAAVFYVSVNASQRTQCAPSNTMTDRTSYTRQMGSQDPRKYSSHVDLEDEQEIQITWAA